MGSTGVDERDAPRERWHFGDFVVESHTRTLTASGVPIALEPQVFDVLVHLLRHRDRVVGKLELLDVVWGDRFVAPATLTSRIRDLRAALGDSGREQRFIKTAHGRGFQFVADTTEESPHTAAALSSLKQLVGRTDELAAIRGHLETERLVTIVGPGGIGKTHLLRHALAGGDAVIIELADVSGDHAVARAALVAVGAAEQADLGPAEVFAEFLEPSSLTIAIDNCEHVIDAVRDLVAIVLARCPNVRVLATSRRPLALQMERAIRLEPLADADAIALLVDHAARHGVELDPADPKVAEICARVDRLPLALELAASKARAIPLGDLLDLLDAGSPILTADAVDAPDHHRSLEAAIEWSVDLLAARQRDLLAALSVFPGSFTLDGARAVGPEPASTLDDLMELRDVSLVDFDPASGRYRLLESIRAHAWARADRATVTAAHRDHTLAVVEAAAEAPTSALLAYLATVGEHWPDVRAVVDRALAASDPVPVHRVIAATIRYGDQTFSFELLGWAEAALSLDEAAGRATPDATRIAAAILQAHAGQFDRSREHLDAVAAPDAPLIELARLWLGYFTGDLEAADAAVDETQAHPLDPLSYERAVGAIGGVFLDVGAGRPVDPVNLETLAHLATIDDDALTAGVRLCGALQLDWATEGDRAIEQLTEVESVARHHGLSFLGAGASTARSIVLATSPDVEVSARGLRATMRSYLETASWQFALADLGAVALTLARHGRPADAAELLAVRDAGGYRGDASNELAEQAADAVAAALDTDEREAARIRGTARDTRSAIAHAVGLLSELLDDREPGA